MIRRFFLDGGGGMSPSRSLVGQLADDELSLVFQDGLVVEHPSGQVVGDDIFEVLASRLDGDPDTHWVGCFGYATRRDLPASPMAGVPDAIWMCTKGVQVATIPPLVGGVVRADEVPPSPSYASAFEQVQEQLHEGNSYEVNLTYRERHRSDRDPLQIHERLRQLNPAPYSGMLRHGDTWLLSASPERFAKIGRDGQLETRPIKGTTPRSLDRVEDERLRHQLATDPKFRSENLMIVDLLRNDLSMVCEPGSVQVPGLMEVESYVGVHQLVSTITGRLRPDVGTLAALKALFPAGSMTGAPKLRTMQIIESVESGPRGLYAGAFGWISGDGRADLGVVIRSLFKGPKTDWILGTGGGITVHSDLTDEWHETLWKAERVRAAL
ncbi:MAG: anthranilate synthase component I family protein [Nocardioidaceae bacterium]|nr:anthranilate synthase component I family protein [Marmoricola sp.]